MSLDSQYDKTSCLKQIGLKLKCGLKSFSNIAQCLYAKCYFKSLKIILSSQSGHFHGNFCPDDFSVVSPAVSYGVRQYNALFETTQLVYSQVLLLFKHFDPCLFTLPLFSDPQAHLHSDSLPHSRLSHVYSGKGMTPIHVDKI